MTRGMIAFVLFVMMLVAIIAASATAWFLQGSQAGPMWPVLTPLLSVGAAPADPLAPAASPTEVEQATGLNRHESPSSSHLILVGEPSVVEDVATPPASPDDGVKATVLPSITVTALAETGAVKDPGTTTPTDAIEPDRVDYDRLSDDIRRMAEALERFNDKLREALAVNRKALEAEQQRERDIAADTGSSAPAQQPESVP